MQKMRSLGAIGCFLALGGLLESCSISEELDHRIHRTSPSEVKSGSEAFSMSDFDRNWGGLITTKYSGKYRVFPNFSEQYAPEWAMDKDLDDSRYARVMRSSDKPGDPWWEVYFDNKMWVKPKLKAFVLYIKGAVGGEKMPVKVTLYNGDTTKPVYEMINPLPFKEIVLDKEIEITAFRITGLPETNGLRIVEVKLIGSQLKPK